MKFDYFLEPNPPFNACYCEKKGGYFDVIVISETVHMRKPDPNIFTYALAQLHVVAQHSVFIGDRLQNDVEAAQRVGIVKQFKNGC